MVYLIVKRNLYINFFLKNTTFNRLKKTMLTENEKNIVWSQKKKERGLSLVSDFKDKMSL